MSKHGARFMLPREHMIDLEVRAIAANEAKATQLAEGLAHAQLALDLVPWPRRRPLAWLEMPDRGCCCLQSDWAKQRRRTGKICSALMGRAAAEQQTKAISTTRMEMQPLLAPPKLVQPRWLPLVCCHRNKFAHTTLVISFAGAVRNLKFLWAAVVMFLLHAAQTMAPSLRHARRQEIRAWTRHFDGLQSTSRSISTSR